MPPRIAALTIDTAAAEVRKVLDEMMPLLLKSETALVAAGYNGLNKAFQSIKRYVDDLGVFVPGFSSHT